MKIGIYTLPLHTNYGGILQAYALQTVLKKMGYEAWLLDRKRNFSLPLKERLKAYIKRAIRKYIFLKKGIVIFLEKKQKREFEIISVNTQKFIEEYIQPSLPIYNVDQIPKDFFDVIIVGSDQIWRPRYNFPKIENAFLDFTKGWEFPVKRISYAASFGTSKWEYDKTKTKRCKELIQKFNAVSVREESGVALCKNNFDVEAQLVLDPTMLLDVSEYIQIAEKCTKDFAGDLFVYILDNNEASGNILNKVIRYTGYNPFYTSTDNHNASLEKRIATPVEEWLKSFLVAKYVVTDSFHACVFSILFNKPFFAIGNSLRGLSRFHSLLSLFKIEDRLLLDGETEELGDIGNEIDWASVNKLLEKYKNISLDFLSKAV
ncbi:polysaccharide pyruvyl transferase family protein [Mariniphaga sediminis]|uniref:polysaccharide pyruvyl transferase family protein n=1 Tax=Mariniphaga sediminis TaxID=1628158 RepID=UPI0035615DEA